MKKKDLILYITICILFIISLLITVPLSSKGELVQIFVDRNLFAEYPIDENNRYVITGANGITLTLNISDGYVDVVDSGCSDKICKKTKAISKTNESIICLPGKIAITVESSDASEFDTISR